MIVISRPTYTYKFRLTFHAEDHKNTGLTIVDLKDLIHHEYPEKDGINYLEPAEWIMKKVCYHIIKERPDPAQDPKTVVIPSELMPAKSRKQKYGALVGSLVNIMTKKINAKAEKLAAEEISPNQTEILTLTYTPTGHVRDYKLTLAHETWQENGEFHQRLRQRHMIELTELNPGREQFVTKTHLQIATNAGVCAYARVREAGRTADVVLMTDDGVKHLIMCKRSYGWVEMEGAKESTMTMKEFEAATKLESHTLSYLLSGITTHRLGAGNLPAPDKAVISFAGHFSDHKVDEQVLFRNTVLVCDPCLEVTEENMDANNILVFSVEPGSYFLGRMFTKDERVSQVVLTHHMYVHADFNDTEKFFEDRTCLPVDSGMIGVYDADLAQHLGTTTEFYKVLTYAMANSQPGDDQIRSLHSVSYVEQESELLEHLRAI